MQIKDEVEQLVAENAELQAELAKRDKGIERLKRQRDEARAQLDADWPKLLRCLESDYNIKASWDGLRKIWLTERADGSAVDAVREFAERYERRIAELGAEVDMLTERKCPGYEPENHYCRYHAQDFELNDSTVSRLKRENARLTKERNRWRMRCGELLDAAHAMQRIADKWDAEVGE